MPEDLVAERIKAVRAHFGQSQRGMADSLGVSVGALQGWELGRSVPNLRAIAKFVYLGVSADWLATGEGAMLRGVGDSEGGGVKGGGCIVECWESCAGGGEGGDRHGGGNK